MPNQQLYYIPLKGFLFFSVIALFSSDVFFSFIANCTKIQTLYIMLKFINNNYNLGRQHNIFIYLQHQLSVPDVVFLSKSVTSNTNRSIIDEAVFRKIKLCETRCDPLLILFLYTQLTIKACNVASPSTNKARRKCHQKALII